jgi:HTH-type transcriptional regulator/antitoxin HipB
MDYLISISDQLVPQLRSLRKARRLGQADLALKLGLSQSRIAAIERNPAAVSAGQLLEILKVLGVDLVLRDTHTTTGEATPAHNISGTSAEGVW